MNRRSVYIIVLKLCDNILRFECSHECGGFPILLSVSAVIRIIYLSIFLEYYFEKINLFCFHAVRPRSSASAPESNVHDGDVVGLAAMIWFYFELIESFVYRSELILRRFSYILFTSMVLKRLFPLQPLQMRNRMGVQIFACPSSALSNMRILLLSMQIFTFCGSV